MQDPLVYLNGEMTPLSEAKIPVLDRGFIFGDGIYDVIPMYGRRLFRAKQHIARLFRSMHEVAIPNPHTEEEWMALIARVSDAHPADDQLIYMQVTRGVAKRAHAFPPEVKPTVFIMTNGLTVPTAQVRDSGVACVSVEDQRWLRCDIKSTSLLGNVLAAQHAAEHGALEAIQFRDGFLTEGASSNVWIVKNGVLMAPPRDRLILEGIRYGLMEELCVSCNIPFQARKIARDEVFAADEVLLSSAGREVLPVSTIDGKNIANGKPGPLFKKLYAAYQDAKNQSCQ
ncbi:MAG TPA: D-amino acid aminotransferase [Noviherbaspirillum sp.]|nr:D-amino acid aminotransferase [Noviherbaspirillum sp.]